jgi:hypothetical protein
MKQRSEGSKHFFFGSKVTIDIPGYYDGNDDGQMIENVFFDEGPVFPCWALFIGKQHAILIKPKDAEYPALGEDEWVRVGCSERMYGFDNVWETADHDQWTRTVTIV